MARYRTVVLAIDNSSCPDGKVCPALIQLDQDDPDTLAVVGLTISDPEVNAALADHIGPGEAAVMVPPALIERIRRGHG